MANFEKVSVETGARVELHDLLSLTGAEISVNSLSAGATRSQSPAVSSTVSPSRTALPFPERTP